MDDRPVMWAEGGGPRCSVCLLREFRVRCSCVDARGIRLGWSGFRTDCGEGGAGKRPSIFLGTSSPMMVAAEGGAADAVCLQVGSHRFSRCYGDRVHALVGQ